MAVKKQPKEEVQPEDFGYASQYKNDTDVAIQEEDTLRKQRANELVSRILSNNEPEPVIDQKKLDRLERMGRINTMGKAASLISDAFSLGIGGNVNRKQPDQTAPALFTAYQNTLDKYKDKKDAYDSRKYADERQKLIFALQQNQIEQNRIDRNKQNEATNEYRSNMLKLKAEQDRIESQLKAYGAETGRMKVEYDNQNKKVANAINASKVSEKTLPEDKPIMYLDETPVTIRGGESAYNFEDIYNEAEKYFLETKGGDYVKGVLANYAMQPINGKKEIVMEYYKQLKAAEAAKKQSTNYFDKLTRPEYVIPGSGSQTKPTQPTKKIKLEKGSLDNL